MSMKRAETTMDGRATYLFGAQKLEKETQSLKTQIQKCMRNGI